MATGGAPGDGSWALSVGMDPEPGRRTQRVTDSRTSGDRETGVKKMVPGGLQK